MNRTLKLLMISDIFIFSGFGLVSPILAVFIKDDLVGGTLFAAGVSSAIFLITHAILQIAFAHYFNPKDRFWMLWLGTLFIVFVPFGYIFSKSIYHIFFVQLIYGIGAGFAYPSWYSLFSSHLDRGQQGFQWSVYNSSVSVGTAITAAVGAFLAEKIGFQLVFSITGFIAFIGLVTLFFLEKKSLKKI